MAQHTPMTTREVLKQVEANYYAHLTEECARKFRADAAARAAIAKATGK